MWHLIRLDWVSDTGHVDVERPHDRHPQALRVRDLRRSRHRHRVAVNARARWTPPHSASAMLVAAGLLIGLTGCASLQPSFCDEFAAAWGHFVDVRDGESPTPMAVIEASHELRTRWTVLQRSGDAPDDVLDMLAQADHNFVSTWNASSPGTRVSYQQSWINSRDYIARQCSKIGVDLEFPGGEVPLEAPRVTGSVKRSAHQAADQRSVSAGNPSSPDCGNGFPVGGPKTRIISATASDSLRTPWTRPAGA
jgi:hypothetical protein